MASEYLSFRLGDARVRLINVGMLVARLEHWFTAVPPEAMSAEEAQEFPKPFRLPMQCVLIETAGRKVLLDTPSYAEVSHSPYFIPDYTPPDTLPSQLEAMGIAAGEIDAVVITHLHFDHYNGSTVEQHGAYVPAFPAARYYIGSEDLQSAETTQALRDPQSLQGRTLAVLLERGLVEAVNQPTHIAPGVTVIPAPGESPGHQILHVESAGRHLYCLGDLVHHAVEIRHPDWSVEWADVAQSTASRRQLIDASLREQALLIATHIPGVCRLLSGSHGVDLVPAEVAPI